MKFKKFCLVQKRIDIFNFIGICYYIFIVVVNFVGEGKQKNIIVYMKEIGILQDKRVKDIVY